MSPLCKIFHYYHVKQDSFTGIVQVPVILKMEFPDLFTLVSIC